METPAFRKQIFANSNRKAELTREGINNRYLARVVGGKVSQALSMLCSGVITRWGSDSPSTSSITARSNRAFRISDGIRVSSFSPSSVSELSKTTASLLSLHAVYMLPNGPMLMRKQPLYNCDMKRSFPDFTTKATKGQSGNYYRKLAKPRDKRNHENMSAKSDELSDFEDNDKYPKQDLVCEFSADSYDHDVKSSSTVASSASEIVALFMKVKSHPKDDSHAKDKGQGVKMSEAKPTGRVESTFLEVLKKYLPQEDVQKNKALHFEAPMGQQTLTQPKDDSHVKDKGQGVKMSEAKPTATVGFTLLEAVKKYMPQKNVQENKALHFEAPTRQRTLTIQSLKSNSLPKEVHTESVEISPSSITEILVVGQHDQRVSAGCQPGSGGLVDDYVNLTQANKEQLESSLQSTTPHMLDTSRMTSMNTSKSMPDELASSLIEHMDLSTLRIAEMRIIAKSRGLKGYSKLKKGELLELLKKNSN